MTPSLRSRVEFIENVKGLTRTEVPGEKLQKGEELLPQLRDSVPGGRWARQLLDRA